MKKSGTVEIARTQPGRQKGEWRGAVVSCNGNMLVITSEGYLRKRDVEKALKATHKILTAWLSE